MSSPAYTDNAFAHEPLPDPAKYVRLLEVLDDNYSKSIKVRCRLTTWPLDSVPPYHAISYTWGDAGSNTTILMNDQPLRVRTNCEFALKQAYWYKRSHSYLYRKWRSRCYEQNRGQWYSKSRYIWLDAICIDQTTLDEKNKQVAMMGNIYKRASCVLACIGDHADDSLLFFQSLYGLAHYVVRPRDMIRHARSGSFGVSFKFRLLHRYSTTHRFVLALARLATRPYFTRVWILQELQHAQHVTILCGQYVLPNNDTRYILGGLLEYLQQIKEDSLANNIYGNIQVHVPFEDLIHRKLFRRHVNYGFPHPVWHGDWMYELPEQCAATLAMLRQDYITVEGNVFKLLKEVLWRLQCQDPRDKVYGIISLIHWGDIPPLEPDYAQNDIEVAVKFIEAMMKLGEIRDIGEPIWRYVIIIIRLMNLNTKSPGLAEALEARRGAPGDCSEEPSVVPVEGVKVRVQQRGWRLSPEDIDENTSKLQDLQAMPPKYPHDDPFLLPEWTRADDWVIGVNILPTNGLWYDLWYDSSDARYQMEPTYHPLLVMREGANGHCNVFIGYGFYSNLNRYDPPSFKQDRHVDIDVFFDIEDAIVSLWRMKQLCEQQPGSIDWMIDFLDIGVCRQQTPGSSHAIVPPNLPERGKRVPRRTRPEPGPPRTFRLASPLLCKFVLWDTKARRGWLVNGYVVALQLLCAYLKNIPQAEPFDFSRLRHINNKSPTAAYAVLESRINRSITIFRVLKDIGEAPEHGESSGGGQAMTEKKFLGEVIEEIYRILLNMKPFKPLPGEVHQFLGIEIMIARHRNTVIKGWDFERIYRTNKAKLYTHVFENLPIWHGFVEELRAPWIFGSDFGEVLQPDSNCCPYFKALPGGQDYLAVAMHTLQECVDKWASEDVKSEVVARLSNYYAWEHSRSVRPFGHLHGQGDHLEQVDSSCFPVQRVVKVPHINKNQEPKLLKKSKPRLYSSQDVEDMNVGVDEDTDWAAGINRAQSDKRPPKAGMIVFGNRPDEEKVRSLAQASKNQRTLSKSATGARNSQLRVQPVDTERAGTGESDNGMIATEFSWF